MARWERKTERVAAPAAPTAAYAVVGRLAEVWGCVHASGAEAVLVTDGHTPEILGRGGLAASYATQAQHRFQPSGDPVAILQELCRGSTYFHVDGPTAAARAAGYAGRRLADRYRPAPLSTVR